jgi:hypothetical protein
MEVEGPAFWKSGEGWDRTNLYLGVIPSEAFFSGAEGPASVLGLVAVPQPVLGL